MLKDRIAVIAAEAGDSWLDALQTAVNAHNSLDAKALLDNAPEDVEGNDELRFRLRQENAGRRHGNVELATKRREQLEADGGSGRCCRRTASRGARACPIGPRTCTK